jgi:hypothetical protein
VLAAFIAAVLLDFSSRNANTDAAIQGSQAASASAEMPIEGSSQAASASTVTGSVDAPQTTSIDEDGVAVSDAVAIISPAPPEAPAVEVPSTSTPDPVQGSAASTPEPVEGGEKGERTVDTSSDPRPPQSEAPSVQTASASTPDPVQGSAKATPVDAVSVAFPLAPETPAIRSIASDGPALYSAVVPFGPFRAFVQVASLSTTDPVLGPAKEETSSVEIFDECLVVETCIDRYLFALYERAPKLDTTKVRQQIKVTVKKKGKTRTVAKTLIKLVDNDFTWKDPKAAERVHMSLMDYVIGGMDRRFKVKLYHALRAMDQAGLVPGITSGFRDDYRQSIASGQKAASNSSYHGGSRRGGYGHGLAADIVSVRGATRDERWRSSEVMWKWVDAHGAEFGIGRPYLDRDPPHVGPIDGQEYVDKRGRGHLVHAAHTKQAGLANRHHRSVTRDDHRRSKRTTTASAKAKST